MEVHQFQRAFIKGRHKVNAKHKPQYQKEQQAHNAGQKLRAGNTCGGSKRGKQNHHDNTGNVFYN